MQARIRIIKRGEASITKSVLDDHSEKADRERERATANTVKNWIADWEARNRLVKAAALELVRSLENQSENPTRRFAVVKG